MQQHTLREAVVFEGVGLHTGAAARVRLEPAQPDAGLRFRLGRVEFPALAEYVIDTDRATVLGSGGASVSTAEHVLSALCGMEIDNATIDVTGPEIPVMDGSARAFADAIGRVGRDAQSSPRATFRVDAPRFYRDGDALLVVLPADEWRVRFAVDFEQPVGSQFFDGAVDRERYQSDIAPCRTFGYLHEMEALLERGLARGATLDNVLVFGPDGPLTALRMPGEVVGHKVLDLIGDFALLGARPACEIIAIKSGHRLHARATRDLRAGARKMEVLAG